MTPKLIKVKVSPRRYIVVTLNGNSWNGLSESRGPNGEATEGYVYSSADILCGPASWEEVTAYLAENAPRQTKEEYRAGIDQLNKQRRFEAGAEIWEPKS